MAKRPKSQPLAFDVSAWPALPPMAGLFVAGTGPGVGKTLVAGAIARTLARTFARNTARNTARTTARNTARRLGRLPRRVEVFKPVATGCRVAREGLISCEAEFLGACAESRRTLAEITPVRYRPAICPSAAAEMAGRAVDLPAVFAAYADIAGSCDCVIVEGPGGLCTPLTDAVWTAHFAVMTALPVVIVVPAGVGAVNQALAALCVARAAGLKVVGFILNRYRIDPTVQQALDKGRRDRPYADEDLAAYTNPVQITERARLPVLSIIPEDPESSVQAATLGADVEFAVSVVDWPGLAGLA